MSKTSEPTNRLLAALPAKDYKLLLPDLEEVALTYTKIIYEPAEIIRHVYFPKSGIVSLISVLNEHSLLELGIVGNEGIVGLSVFLGVKTSNNRSVVQGAGVAMRIKTSDFLARCKDGGALAGILQHYTHSLLTQISQSAACNRFHVIEARLARWLLMTGDRMMSDEFKITQEFLSHMLGVRREAVTLSARNLQHNGLISYSRGNITITNRAGLEAAACGCYYLIKAEYENFPTKFKTH